MKTYHYLFIWSLIISLSFCQAEAENKVIDLLKELEELSSSFHERREDDINYEWDFLKKSSELVERPLLVEIMACLKEKNLTRYAGLKYSIMSLDKETAITGGENLLFAWKWKPESFTVASSKREGNSVEAMIEETLEDSKIYSGYKGITRISFAEENGHLKVKNIFFKRKFTQGEVWEADLLTYLKNYAKELERSRINALSKNGPRADKDRQQLPLEILEKIE